MKVLSEVLIKQSILANSQNRKIDISAFRLREEEEGENIAFFSSSFFLFLLLSRYCTRIPADTPYSIWWSDPLQYSCSVTVSAWKSPLVKIQQTSTSNRFPSTVFRLRHQCRQTDFCCWLTTLFLFVCLFVCFLCKLFVCCFRCCLFVCKQSVYMFVSSLFACKISVRLQPVCSLSTGLSACNLSVCSLATCLSVCLQPVCSIATCLSVCLQPLCLFDCNLSVCLQPVCSFATCLSPWYNRDGWLDVKHQVTYLEPVCLFACSLSVRLQPLCMFACFSLSSCELFLEVVLLLQFWLIFCLFVWFLFLFGLLVFLVRRWC